MPLLQRRRRVSLLASLVALTAACGGGGDTPSPAPPAAAPVCSGQGTLPLQTLAYRSVPGVPADLLSVDLVLPRRDAGCPAAPLVVYIHG
ncbi:MAG: hypothetical protein RL227_623, partial [Pseudomonadota bacterium]